MNARAKIGLAAVVVALGAFAPFLPYLGKQFVNDWGYFNSLSLVVRSIVLEFRRFPGHNPWVCGGLDLLANPQNRVFSPLVVADLLLRPQWANFAGLVAYAVVGFIGARLLLAQLGARSVVASVGAVLYLHSSWFGFHYTEGHIPFGAMQLLPWMAYLALRSGSRRHLILLGFSISLMLLDGQMYPFIFSILTIVSFLVLGRISLRELKAAVVSRPLELIVVCLATAALAMPKMLPVLWTIRDRGPELDFHSMSTELVVQALFEPFHSLFEQPATSTWRFHEYACYVSPLGIVLVLAGGSRPLEYWRRAWPFLLAALFWFWVGSGWYPESNPWLLFQKIPLINNAHVQSRVLIIMYLFFVILVTLALERLRTRHMAAFVIPAALLVAEAVVVHGYPMLEAPRPDERAPTQLIRSRRIQYTTRSSWSSIPKHYYQELGSADCYEPSFRPTAIRYLGHREYCGEVCLADPAAGTARLTRYSPGRLSIEYELSRPTMLELNMNALYGWKIRGPSGAKVHGRGLDRLRIEPDALSGRLRLHYWPPYMPWVFASLAVGVVLFATLWLRSRGGAGSPPP